MAREFDFYIVPTPIGNIADITLRAIEILKSVDIIACEDTRITQKLLNHYSIGTRCVSYHKYNERERVTFFLQELKDGKRIALVSDAGTPMICDPGNIIVDTLRKEGFSITSLPGACAITTFLSQIPRQGEEFCFVGFSPRGEKQITEMCKKYTGVNFVFYESPERLLKTLEYINNSLGDVEVAIGRELSKLFEEIFIGSVSKALEHFDSGIKGEIICMVYASENSEELKIEQKIKELKTKGFKDREISIILSTVLGLSKNEVYKKSLDLN